MPFLWLCLRNVFGGIFISNYREKVTHSRPHFKRFWTIPLMLCIYSVYVYMYECFCIIIMMIILKTKLRYIIFYHPFSSTSLSNICFPLAQALSVVILLTDSVESRFSIGAKLTDLLCMHWIWCMMFTRDEYNLFVYVGQVTSICPSSYHAHCTFHFFLDFPTVEHQAIYNLFYMSTINTANIMP